MTWKDPIVEEVRAIRAKIVAECGNDPARMLDRERKILRRWKGRVVTKEDLVGAGKPSSKGTGR